MGGTIDSVEALADLLPRASVSLSVNWTPGLS